MLIHNIIKILNSSVEHILVYKTPTIVKSVVPASNSKQKSFKLTVEIDKNRDHRYLQIRPYSLGRIIRNISCLDFEINTPYSGVALIDVNKIAPFYLRSKFVLEIVK